MLIYHVTAASVQAKATLRGKDLQSRRKTADYLIF